MYLNNATTLIKNMRIAPRCKSSTKGQIDKRKRVKVGFWPHLIGLFPEKCDKKVLL